MKHPRRSTRRPSDLGSGYRRLWASATLSNLGDGIRAAAFPLIASSLTRDPALVAGVTVAATLPWLLLGLPAGAIVDRADRRDLLVRANLARGVVVALLGLTVVFGIESLLVVYLVVFLIGAAETLVDTAAQSIVPALVGKGRLHDANGYLVTSKTVANEFAGVTLGGLLFAAGIWVPLLAEAATMLVAAGVAFGLRGAFRPDRSEGTTSRVLTEVREGLGWLVRQRVLRTLIGLVAVIGLVDTAWFAILVLYALQILGLDPVGFALLLAVGAGGSVLGGVTAATLVRRLGSAPVLLSSVALMAATQVAIGLTSSGMVAGVMIVWSGFAFAVWNVVAVSLRQMLAPDRLLGRVHATYLFAGAGAQPVGALLGGLVAQAWGLRAPFLVGALVLVVAAAFSWPALRSVTAVETTEG